MKILVFGFKPYRNYTENVTEKIIKKLKRRKNLQKIIFSVKFDKKMFLNAIQKYNPDTIIGLGQHPRAQKIRIERRAVNSMQPFKNKKARHIEKGSPRYRFINLKLKSDQCARITYDAGNYVCNFCMYIISEYARQENIQFAFLHIPQNYDINKAVKFIDTKIKNES